MLGIDNTITFKPDTHQYFDKDGNEYQSVTRVLKKLQVPFDRQGRSLMMAKGIAAQTGVSVEQAQKQLLSEWDAKRDSASDRGTSIHGRLENYLKHGKIDQELNLAIEYLKTLIVPTYRYYSEIILYDQATKIAGQTDLVIQRQKSTNSLYDFYDYKTNESKGIEFDSINRKDLEWKHYNKNFLAPLDHLEDCNYHTYALQLSIYACLAQVTYGIKIGRLAIIFIGNNMQVTVFPVPYMKFEALMVLDYVSKLNPLPKVVSKSISITQYEQKEEVTYSEDWE